MPHRRPFSTTGSLRTCSRASSAAAAAGLQGDVPLLLGITLFSALFVSVGNLIADLLYGVVDPRVREVGA